MRTCETRVLNPTASEASQLRNNVAPKQRRRICGIFLGGIYLAPIDHIWHNLEQSRRGYIIKPNLSDHYPTCLVYDKTVDAKQLSIRFRNCSARNVEMFEANIFFLNLNNFLHLQLMPMNMLFIYLIFYSNLQANISQLKQKPCRISPLSLPG